MEHTHSAMQQTGQNPSDATMYVLRHSTITDLVHGGLDLLTVAQIAGCRQGWLKAHYGHLRSEVAATALKGSHCDNFKSSCCALSAEFDVDDACAGPRGRPWTRGSSAQRMRFSRN